MANITKVYLMSVPLDKDYAHTFYFGTEGAQQTYFQSQIGRSFTDFSYQRKDGVIRLPIHIDDILNPGYNYVMYQNTAYSNKWFYAFIESVEYINDGRTDVKIRTDCIQTWMFDITVHTSFVEREHTKYDSVGRNTVDEGLELGEYVANNHVRAEYAGYDLSVVIAATKSPEGDDLRGTLYNNLYSGVNYYSFGISTADLIKINSFLSGYDSEGIGEAITCMFLAPKKLTELIPDTNKVFSTAYTNKFYINPESSSQTGETKEFSNNKLDGYTPRNNKLLCFPYRYLLVANNAGSSIPMKYERFYKVDSAGNKTSTIPRFVIEGALCPGCSIRMVPLYYNGVPRNDEEGINMGKFPALNWNSDVYTNWLTQNSVNNAVQVVSGIAQIAGGVALAAGTAGLGAGAGAGSIVGGVSQIAGTLTQIHQQSFAPPQAKGNLNAGDVVTAGFQNDFHFYDMSVKAEYAKIIDGFFDMYGYKCHQVKVPYTAHREKYWYTKTIDANITGRIPQDDLQVIKDCYNRGITFWRSNSIIKDYSVANGIV